jgi:pimeloyl-ACP methyl ester carboxylesterase
MGRHSHQTAPTRFVEADGIRFAYRRFGKTSDVPIVFNLHYIGTMDYWDPAVTDGLARDREVILFDNAGVSSSSGEVPAAFEEMGAHASKGAIPRSTTRSRPLRSRRWTSGASSKRGPTII